MTPTSVSYSVRVAQKIPGFQTDAYCAIPTSPEISSNVHFPIKIKNKKTHREKKNLLKQKNLASDNLISNLQPVSAHSDLMQV